MIRIYIRLKRYTLMNTIDTPKITSILSTGVPLYFYFDIQKQDIQFD